MLLYCDASCLVKLYVSEDHSALARAWVADAQGLVTSELSYVEVCGALVRRQREGRHSAAALAAILDRFREDWPSFHRMVLDSEAGTEQVLRHPLRALDAIHLAAALSLRDAAPDATVAFASFDDRQRRAAEAAGLNVLRSRVS
jgi:predicted nucleic acid-binding protein